MKSYDSIEVLLYRHPFKTEREKIEIKKDSFIKIHKNLQLEFPISDYIFLDGDEIIKDFSKIPNNDYICIKCVPQGSGGDFQKEGTGFKIAGGALVVAGILITALGGGIVGIPLITTGLVTFGSGVYLYNYELDTDSYSDVDKPKNSPSIKGASNSRNLGGRIPVLLGRHLVTPFVAANAFTSTPIADGMGVREESKNQYLHLLLCSGYSGMEIDEDTIQFGEVPISSYSGVSYEIQESSSQNTYFPVRVLQETINTKLDRQENGVGALDNVVVRTTATNTKSVKITVVLPNGLYYVENDGDITFAYLDFIIEWKNVEDPDTAYQKVWTIGEAFGYSGYEFTRLGGHIQHTCRATFSIDFSDTNANKQYTIRLRHNASGDADPQSVDTIYWEDMKSYVKDSNDNTDPINSGIKEDLNIIGFKILATNQLSGTVDNVNYEATAYARTYSGSGSGSAQWASETLTSNPASIFLKVLTDSHINKNPIESADEDSRIDFSSLEEWYTFCESKGFECNVYEVGETTVKDVLNNICSVGRASWSMVNNKYTVVVDTYKSDIIQYFTPRNTYGFSASKTFYDLPTCFKINFIDKDNGYVEASRYVYYDSYNGDPRSTDIVEEMNMYGAMGAEQVWKLGRYAHATTRLRPEIFTFSTDIEYIMCTRGDRIKLNHDVPLFGLSNGRVVSPIESEGNTLGFVSDEILQFELNKDYAVTMRLQDGTSITRNLINPGMDTTSVLFETKLIGDGILFEDDLFLFGEQGSVDVDLIVNKIEPNEELGATITCVEYNEVIYTSDTGSIPSYNPKISKGGSSVISVGELPETQEDKVAQNQQIITLTDQVTYSLSASYPDSFQSTTVQGTNPSSYDDNNYIYINQDDSNKIYKKTLMGEENGTAINTADSSYPTVMGDYIYYINANDGNKIYQKGKTTTTNGSAFTTNGASKLIIDTSLNTIYYINTSDNNYIYKIPPGTSGNGSVLLSTSVTDIGISGLIFFYTPSSDSYIYAGDVNDLGNAEIFYNVGNVSEFFVSNTGYVYYLKTSDSIIYRKTTTNLSSPTVEGDPLYGVAGSFGISYNGDVIFSSTAYSNYLFLGLATASIQNASLESVGTSFSLTGTLTNGSTVITGISVEDLSQIVKRDSLVHTYIPDGTKILMKGNNFLYMTNPATGTASGTSINVYGSRITLNANRVVIPGTVTAELLEASAISSKATTIGGYHKSEFDLDSGIMKFRKDDDTIVMDFDPSRSGSELTIAGTISLQSGSTGTDGNPVPTETDLDGKVTTFYQASAPTATATGDLWVDTDDGNKMYRWNGSSWVDIQDDAISAAQATADGKIVTYYQTSAPTGTTVGDLWVDTDDGNKMYRWNGSAWIDIQDTAIVNAQATADGKITTFYQTSAPTAEGVGDLWVDTDDSNKLYRWSGSAWVSVRDETIDTKTTTYYQTTAPSSPSTGDIWIDTDNNNLKQVYTGSTWSAVSIQSDNFVTGSDGWQILNNGDVEFNNGTFRGELAAATGTFSGNITADEALARRIVADTGASTSAGFYVGTYTGSTLITTASLSDGLVHAKQGNFNDIFGAVRVSIFDEGINATQAVIYTQITLILGSLSSEGYFACWGILTDSSYSEFNVLGMYYSSSYVRFYYVWNNGTIAYTTCYSGSSTTVPFRFALGIPTQNPGIA